ncbi:MAG: hypothetical protein HYT94_00460 [Parcubacteria group bacterium]|nr:hypothetical protein [Parcubacteria group bacterium]
MESIVKSDIFFFITTVCVLVITVFVVMILLNVLRVTRSVREIAEKAKGEAEGFASDIAAFRAMLRENQFGLKPLREAFRRKKSATEKRARKVKKAAEDIINN